MRNLKAALLVLLISALTGEAGAQSWRGPAALGVEARSRKGGPIAGARVTLRYQGIEPAAGPSMVATDSKGRAVLANLAEGEWHLEVRHEDFLTYIAMISLQAGKKPTVSTSFLQAGGRSLTPMKVTFFRAGGRAASPPIAQAEPEAAPAPPLPPLAPAPTEAPTPPAPDRAEPPSEPAQPEPVEPEPVAVPAVPQAPELEPTPTPTTEPPPEVVPTPLAPEPEVVPTPPTQPAPVEPVAKQPTPVEPPETPGQPLAIAPPPAEPPLHPEPAQLPPTEVVPAEPEAPQALEERPPRVPSPAEEPAPTAPTETPAPPLPTREMKPPAAQPPPVLPQEPPAPASMPPTEPAPAKPAPAEPEEPPLPAAELLPRPEPPPTQPAPAEPEPIEPTSVGPSQRPVEPEEIPPPAGEPPPRPEPAPAPLTEPPLTEPALSEPEAPEMVEEPPALAPEAAPSMAPPTPEAPVPTPPRPVIPAPPRTGPSLRSASDGDCAECQAGEWSVSSSQVAGASPAEGSGCPEAMGPAVRQAMEALAGSIHLELNAFAGPAADGSPAEALQTVKDDLASAFRRGIAQGGPHCRAVAVVLPRAARFVGFRYSAIDQAGSGGCQPGEDCVIGRARWLARPDIIRGSSSTVVYGLFQNLAEDRKRRAGLTVFFRPPSANWRPPVR